MKLLAGIEARFQDNVLAGTAAIVADIEGRDDAFRDQRLGIYRDAYRLRLAEVLARDYEALHTCLGDEAFGELARAYLAAHPSTFRNVRWFGGLLARFIEDSPHYASHPEFSELAQFEWALASAFDSPDDSPVRFDDVAAVPPAAWAGLRFRPHPGLQILELRSNAVAIWKAVTAGAPASAAEVADSPVTWVVWRKAYSPYFRSMASDEAWAANALIARSSFGDLCAGMCEWVPEEQAAARAAGLLRGWVEDGWIVELMLPEPA